MGLMRFTLIARKICRDGTLNGNRVGYSIFFDVRRSGTRVWRYYACIYVPFSGRSSRELIRCAIWIPVFSFLGSWVAFSSRSKVNRFCCGLWLFLFLLFLFFFLGNEQKLRRKFKFFSNYLSSLLGEESYQCRSLRLSDVSNVNVNRHRDISTISIFVVFNKVEKIVESKVNFLDKFISII